MRCNDIYHLHKFGSYKNPASILTYGFGRSTNNFLITVFNCDESFEWGDSELHTVPWNKSSHFSKRWKILMGDKTAWNRKAQLEPTVKFEQLNEKKCIFDHLPSGYVTIISWLQSSLLIWFQ